MENQEPTVSEQVVAVPTDWVMASLLEVDKTMLVDKLVDMHPNDLARLFESIPGAQRAELLTLMSEEQTSLVLPELGDEVLRQVLIDMPKPQLSVVAELLESGDLAEAIDVLPDDVSSEILASLDQDNRARLEAVLDYPLDSAGRLMTTDVLSVRPRAKLSVVLRWLRKQERLPRYTSTLMVTDSQGRYLGNLPIGVLVTESPDATVEQVMEVSGEVIRANESEHVVAVLFEQRDLITVAVLDDDDRLLGRITVDDAMDILRREADHTVLSQAGLNDEADLFAPILPSAKQRGVWLGINLITVFLAAWVIGQFQHALDQLVALAVLMPIVASMGGIAGSQTLTLTIRGLALDQIAKGNVRWLATKELGVGALNGIVWSFVVAVASYLWFKNFGLSVVIAVATILNLLVAAVSGVAVPLILKRVGMDPALAGAVVLTTVTDIVGFLSFLGLASIFLL